MTAQSKAVIKSYFQTNDRPTQAQFENLIDSYQDYGTLVSNYYVDSGVQNAYVITTSPATTSYIAGMKFSIKIGNTNNGNSTLNAGGGPLNILYIDGTNVNPGALPGGGIVELETDTLNWYLLNIIPAASGGGITALTGDVTASGSGSVTATIANDAVTTAKILNSNVTTAKIADNNVTLGKLATQAANTVLANATSGSAVPTAVALSASNLLGMGSTGNIAPITVDSTLTFTGTVLSVTGGAPTAATQSDQETATSTTTYVSPGRQQFHPSAAKAWLNTTGTTSPSIAVSYNITSISDQGVGELKVTIATDFSTANFAVVGSVGNNDATPASTDGIILSYDESQITSGQVYALCSDSTGTLRDPSGYHLSMFGDI